MLSQEEVWQKRIAPFVCLWKTDNPKWVAEREVQWKLMRANYFNERLPVSDLRILSKYYLSGEVAGYISATFKFILAPTDSADTAAKLFNSDNFGAEERRKIYRYYLSLVSQIYDGAEWQHDRTLMFIDGVMGRDYRLIEESTGPKHTKIVSPDPARWAANFCVKCRMLIEGRIPYHPDTLAVDYFISCLAHVDSSEGREAIDIEELNSGIDRALKKGKLPDKVRVFCEELKSRRAEIVQAWT